MKIAGIICEYNPFHNGHAYQIEKTREILGKNTAIVCVMSGNFVQRGDMAVFDKHSRALAALMCGADLVVELPIPWVLSSAERFAYGGVSILHDIGCTHISFGSESGDSEAIKLTADIISSDIFNEKLTKELYTGKSYAKACADSLSDIVPEASKIVCGANDLLGIEYAKAVKKLESRMDLIAIKRLGANHDSMSTSSENRFASASYIRLLLKQNICTSNYMPKPAVHIFKNKSPVSIYDCEQAVLSRLRMLNRDDYEKLDSSREGFYIRFMKHAKTADSIDSLLNSIKTKRYSMSRIRRMMICACLGITPEMSYQKPPYIRILAANKTGCSVISRISEDIQVITKPASVKKFGKNAQQIFELESSSTDFYTLALKDRGGHEWQQSPVIITE